MVAAEHDVRSDLHMEAAPVGRDAQRPDAARPAADDGAQLGPRDREGRSRHPLTIEAVEHDVLQGDGLDRVELVRQPLRGEVEPAGDDAVAGEAGEVDFHAASVRLGSSAGHTPNVRLRPGPVASGPCGSAHHLVVRCAGRRLRLLVRVTGGPSAARGGPHRSPLRCARPADPRRHDPSSAAQASSRSTATREAGWSRGAGTSLTFGTNEAASDVAAATSWSATDRIPRRPSWASSSRM